MAMKCRYCEEPAYLFKYMDPPLCEKHIEMVLFIQMVKNRVLEVRLDNVREVYEELGAYAHLNIQPLEIERYFNGVKDCKQ